MITIDVPAGSTTLVNLTDEGEYSAASLQDVKFTNGASPQTTLWNFSVATSLKLVGGSASWQGTILAPYATVNRGFTNVYGSLVVMSLINTGFTFIAPFRGCLPDPEPCPPVPPNPTPTPTSTPIAARRRRPTPTASPTATPTRSHGRRRRTPTPTRGRRRRPERPLPTLEPPGPRPQPIVSPTATPVIQQPGQPLGPEETPGSVDVGASRATCACARRS